MTAMIRLGAAAASLLVGLVTSLLVGLATTLPLAAQGPDDPGFRGHALSVGLGLDHRALRDEHASPLRYSGAGVPVEVGYRYDGGRWHHRVDVSFRSATLTSSIDHDEAPGGRAPREELLAGRFRYAAMRDVGGWRGVGGWPGVALRAGGSLEGEGEQRDHTYLGDLDETYLLALLAVGPALEAVARVSPRSEVEASLAVPIAAIVMRESYAVKGSYAIRSEVVGGFARVLPRVTWRWRPTRAVALAASVRGRWGRVAEPSELRTLDRSVVVSAEWRP